MIETISSYYELRLEKAIKTPSIWGPPIRIHHIINNYPKVSNAHFRLLIDLLMRHNQIHTILPPKWSVWYECQNKIDYIDVLIELNVPIVEGTIASIRDPILRAKLKDYYDGPAIKEPETN